MENRIIEIWAKSKQYSYNQDGNLTKDRIVTLVQHIQDVLNAFNHLTDITPKNVLPEELIKLIEITIQYHDIGKVLPYFQRKTIKNESYLPFDVFVNIPHSIFSSLMIDMVKLEEKVFEILNDRQKSQTYVRYIVSAVAYHHWRENFYDLIEGFTNTFEQLQKLKNNQEKWHQIEENIQQVYKDLNLPDWFQPYLNERWLDGLNNGIKYADYVIPPYLLYRMPKRISENTDSLKDWILISGFTMLSDHFASYVESLPDENTTLKDIEIKGIVFEEIKKKIEEELKRKIGVGYQSNSIWQFNYVEKYKDDNAVLLAPTGMGKTEFAYLWSNGEKFFYTLPLRTAVNQIFNRTKLIFGEDKAGLLHSDADIFLYGNGAETESMRVYEIAKQLSSPAIISTGDQFFPYALRPPSYERIFAKLSYSRLVIDEVQAYDPKAAAIIVKFIEHIVQMGGKFLLMTATLPEFIRKEIERRVDLKNENILNLFDEDEQLANFSKHHLKVITDKYSENKNSYSKEVLEQIISKAKHNGGSRVLAIMNTVKQAQEVYEDLVRNSKSEIEIKLFHSRYTQQHRKATEESLEKFIGNNPTSRQDKRPKILVATQVVEASLDLDADFIFTELAPWDSLIQRMGRCFRELRVNASNAEDLIQNRYGGLEIPENVFILIYDGKRNGKTIYESSSGFVYHNELLRTTLKLIEERDISEPDLEKWNNGTKHEIKNFDKIKSFLLSESSKSELVDKLYNGLSNESNYLRKFYNMLQVLDSGFMSDRKSEAQKAFREINNVDIIAESRVSDFYQSIKAFNFQKKYAYTRFKKEIMSQFVIGVQRNKVNEYLFETNEVAYRMKLDEMVNDDKVMKQLKNWIYGVYFIPLEYSDSGGLIGIKESNSYDFL